MEVKVFLFEYGTFTSSKNDIAAWHNNNILKNQELPIIADCTQKGCNSAKQLLDTFAIEF